MYCELYQNLKIGILALQGAFAEHEHVLDEMGVPYRELRRREDLDTVYNGFILPGGESTVQSRLLNDLDMFVPLKKQIENGAATLATCAGLILLARCVEQGAGSGAEAHVHGGALATMAVTAVRNAYGRQLASFHAHAPFAGIGDVPMTFIRAPYIGSLDADTQALATVDGRIVAAREGNQLACAFHPELDDDTRIHELFLSL